VVTGSFCHIVASLDLLPGDGEEQAEDESEVADRVGGVHDNAVAPALIRTRAPD
jgi:hypothetical protein